MRAFPPGFKVNIALFFFYQQLLKDAISRYLLYFISYILWIPKILVQFCYLRLYISPDLSSARQRIQSRMDMPVSDMDWNLKKLGPLFQDLICLQKSPNNLLWFSAHWRSLFDIFFTALQEHFVYGKPGGVTQQMFIRGGSVPSSNPLYDAFPWAPFYISFFKKKVPLSYKTTCRRFRPFTKPSWYTRSCETRQHRQHIQAPCQHIPFVATPDMTASPHFQQHGRNKTN